MGVVRQPDVARRIARAVVSDIALYNAKKVEEGVRNDTPFDLLKEEIEEGQGYYLSRVDPEIARTIELLRPGAGGCPPQAGRPHPLEDLVACRTDRARRIG